MSNVISRRTFIKGSALLAAAISMGGCSFMNDGVFKKAGNSDDNMEIFHSACPRNCYDTCSVLSYVQDGVLKKVEGDPKNTYTRGRLCVKGYSYTRSVYSPDRIKYPMRQVGGRGSGKWERISWDEAYDTIAKKILDIKKEYGSTLPICLNRYSGNFNILNYCSEGMMSSIGHTTRAQGTPCWPAGIDAQTFDFGTIYNNDPEDFVNSKLLIIWGANPSWCSVHSMHFVEMAKRNGCKLVVIDPVVSQTASKADLYIQIKPSTDGALALGMARYLLDNNMYDPGWLAANAIGYEEFFDYLRKHVTVDWAAEKTGIPKDVIIQLAHEYGTTKPANIWIGYGMQRHINGGQNVRAIDALAAMTGGIGKSGSGAQYAQLQTWGFNYNAMVMAPPAGTTTKEDRNININNFAEEVMALQDPPVKMLWISCRSPLTQDADPVATKKAFDSMDLVVVTDMFMNPTVEMADIVLPIASQFESWGINVSYWHYWLALNQQAIAPLYECKHDLTIAMELSKRLNELEPGSCTYPTSGEGEEWVAKEFNDGILAQFGITSWKDLEKGPVKAKKGLIAWEDGKFTTPSGKYEFISKAAEEEGHPLLPTYLDEIRGPEEYPLRLICPHWKLSINAQFQNLDWIMAIDQEPFCEIHPKTAQAYGVKTGNDIIMYNDQGEVPLKVKVTAMTAPDTVMVYERWIKGKNFNINHVVKPIPADMGSKATGQPGIAFHDNFVNIRKV